MVLWLSPFYRWGNQSPWRVSNLSKDKQLLGGRDRIQHQTLVILEPITLRFTPTALLQCRKATHKKSIKHTALMIFKRCLLFTGITSLALILSDGPMMHPGICWPATLLRPDLDQHGQGPRVGASHGARRAEPPPSQLIQWKGRSYGNALNYIFSLLINVVLSNIESNWNQFSIAE